MRHRKFNKHGLATIHIVYESLIDTLFSDQILL